MANEVDLLQIKIEQAKEKLPADTLNAIASVDWKAAIMAIREKKGYNFEQLGDLELETELLLCGLTTPEEYPKELQRRMQISKAETDELVNTMNELVFRRIKEELIKNTERKRIFQEKSTRNEEEKKFEPKIIPNNPPVQAEFKQAIPAVKTSPVTGIPLPPETPIYGGMNNSDNKVLKSAGIEVEKPINIVVEKPVEKREDILEKIEHPSPTSTVEPMRGEASAVINGSTHPMLDRKIFGSVQMPIVKTEHTMDNIAPTPKAQTINTESTLPKADPYREMPE